MSEFIKPSVSNKVVCNDGREFPSVRKLANALGVSKTSILNKFNKGQNYYYDGKTYSLKQYVNFDVENPTKEILNKKKELEDILNSADYKDFMEIKNVTGLPFETFTFKSNKRKSGSRYAVALFSDAHIEETVLPDSVLGLNEYNVDIAKKRIEHYFINLASCLNEDKVDDLIFASLGDCISGYIHDELSQTNELTPLEATELAQNLVYNGLNYICENTNLKSIKFIGIVGNHSRTTKKIQHSNGYAMSYEWLMYRNVKKQCELTNLPIEFYIPNSEMAIVDTEDKKRFIFIHGFQIKGTGNGTVCGIYPALNRLSLKYSKVFKQDKIYLGHFHSCTSIPNAVVNGSIIGYNAFSLSNGFGYEQPAQMYELYDTSNGLLLTRQIYCE